MKSIARLKEIARSHEQKEEWDKAIQVYEQVLERARAGEAEMELPLFNRVGDLHLRLGRADEAVRYYEEAADHYAEEGLFNNAIALCSKALRHQPDRIELYRKLGRLSVRQGFLTDARRWFLEYADRQLKVGARRDALAALEEFAELANDAEARELLAGHLEAQGELPAAVEQLRQAYFIRLAGGDSERVAMLRERILSLDPQSDLTPPDDRPAVESPEAFDPLSIPALPGIDLQTAADAAGIEEASEESDEDSIESLLAAVRALPDDEAEAPGPALEPLPLLDPAPEPSDFGTIDLPAGPLPGLDDHLAAPREGSLEAAAVAPVEAPVEGEDVFDLPDDMSVIGDVDLPTLDDPVTDPVAEGPEAFEPEPEPTPEDVAAPAPPEETAPAADDGYIDLGELLSDTLNAIAEAPAPARHEKDEFGKLLDQFRAQASAQVGSDNPAGHYDLGLAFKEMGLIDEAIAEFLTALEGGEAKLKVYEELGQCYMQRGQYSVAVGVFDRALQLPYGDERELIGVCYHLGRCYEELGRRQEARAMYARVTAVDPGFRDVAARLIGL